MSYCLQTFCRNVIKNHFSWSQRLGEATDIAQALRECLENKQNNEHWVFSNVFQHKQMQHQTQSQNS